MANILGVNALRPQLALDGYSVDAHGLLSEQWADQEEFEEATAQVDALHESLANYRSLYTVYHPAHRVLQGQMVLVQAVMAYHVSFVQSPNRYRSCDILKSCPGTIRAACLNRRLHADHTNLQSGGEIMRRAAFAVQFLIHHGRLVIRAKDIVEVLTAPANDDIQCSVYILLSLTERMRPVAELKEEDGPWQCLAYVHQPNPRTAATYRATNHAIAEVLRQTYTTQSGSEDPVAAKRYFWFDQLFALMNFDYS